MDLDCGLIVGPLIEPIHTLSAQDVISSGNIGVGGPIGTARRAPMLVESFQKVSVAVVFCSAVI